MLPPSIHPNGTVYEVINNVDPVELPAELEKAAEIYAKEPLPTMVLKSTGTNLPSERIKALLESWKVSR